MKSLVTIITPTYNHEEFIKKCIESVLGQTYSNWEMIIIDDSSNDKTNFIITKFAKTDSRIKIIRHIKNWGVTKLSESYNQALKISKGKFVAILEGDDWWPKNKLEIQIKGLECKNASFSFGNCILTSQNGTPIRLFTYNLGKQLLSNDVLLKLFSTLNFSIIPVTVVIRKRELLSIGGFQKDNDYPFTDIPSFIKLSRTGKFIYQDEILGFYRKQHNSHWFNFAKNTLAMGKEEMAKCINRYLSKKTDKYTILKTQSKLIRSRKGLRWLSVLTNKMAFNINPSPLFLIFIIEYLIYKLKKVVV